MSEGKSILTIFKTVGYFGESSEKQNGIFSKFPEQLTYRIIVIEVERLKYGMLEVYLLN